LEGQRPGALRQRQRRRGAAGLRPVFAARGHPAGAGDGARGGRGDAPGGPAGEGGHRRDLLLGPRRQGLFRGGATARRGPVAARLSPLAPASGARGERTPENFMNPIDALFQRLRSEGRKAFIPFVTAGDPDLDVTAREVEVLAANGASLIEV